MLGTAQKDMTTKLHSQLADVQHTTKQKEDALDKTIKSLRADLEVQNAKSSTSFVNPGSNIPDHFLVLHVR